MGTKDNSTLAKNNKSALPLGLLPFVTVKAVYMKPGFAIYYSQSVRLTYAIFTIAIIINFIRIFSLLHSLAKKCYNYI